MARINDALDRLFIQSRGEIKTRIEEISFNIAIEDTKTVCHCYCLKVDGNGNLRLIDLIEFIDEKIVEYAIPKKELDDAKNYMDQTGSPAKLQKLRRKAENLFTELEKTGEGGEILLYILVQEFLKLPQLISKMSLKTSGKLHYQGADGIHVDYDNSNNTLNLYWGEAKMYSDISEGINACIGSIKSFLLDSYSSNSVQERDLQLITSNIAANVNDEELENALVRYFDKDDDLSNFIVYKGLCFIGFDLDCYPAAGIQKTISEIKLSINAAIKDWHKTLSSKIKASTPLDLKDIHVFLLPFPSVADFRKHYLEIIK